LVTDLAPAVASAAKARAQPRKAVAAAPILTLMEAFLRIPAQEAVEAVPTASLPFPVPRWRGEAPTRLRSPVSAVAILTRVPCRPRPPPAKHTADLVSVCLELRAPAAPSTATASSPAITTPSTFPPFSERP